MEIFNNMFVQGILGILIVLPLFIVVNRRIERLDKLNQYTKAHFDIWRELHKGESK